MLFDLFSIINSFYLFFILHVTGAGSFPKPLSAQEEKQLLIAFSNGDLSARNKLVEHNLRLVAHIIKKYYSANGEQDDLVSIGTIGLIKAVNTFKLDKNIKLSSYASRCIENEILMHFRNCKKTSQDISLNETIDSDKDGNPLTLMDVMSAEEDIIEKMDLKHKREKLSEFLNNSLSERERNVIILRYGLNGCAALTQHDVAKKLNISRSYVSRIEKKPCSL